MWFFVLVVLCLLSVVCGLVRDGREFKEANRLRPVQTVLGILFWVCLFIPLVKTLSTPPSYSLLVSSSPVKRVKSMKKIEGLSLSEILAAAENEALAEKRMEVHRKVSGIVLNLQQWSRELLRLNSDYEKSKKKLEGRIEKAKDKVKALKEEKWEVLEDENDKKSSEQQTADAD